MTGLSPTQSALGKVLTLPGVYAPQSDSLLLACAVRREGVRPGMELLDVGTGSGALAVYAARMGARVTAVDIGRRAVLTTRLNALLAHQHVTVRRSDLAASLPGRSFDVVISNPPYVPAPGRLPPCGGAARAWDAGQDGRALVDRICDTAPGLLRSRGVLLMVHSRLCDPAQTLLRLFGAGLRATVSDRTYVPFGPVIRGRLAWLRQRGLLGPYENEEELVVIRAEKP
ncbi:HemK2/MTQ2 family protein methyltransferase [Streptomyces sp. NPDC050804]|uniref:HemK2/MTQ2 family protein methyltransferase n=1 Tax=unclassified Streptomyces TaxID=2593676 RepID=UPI0034188797|nr:methyltransferase [Streptomyces sp. NBC_00872]